MKKKRLFTIGKLAVILLSTILLTVMISQPSIPALSKVGSRGEEVKQIQTVLKDRELYTGNIDGIFGEQTKQAVIKF